MSWQQYIDEHMMMELPSGNSLSSAAIVGYDGNVWAQSPTYPQFLEGEFERIMGGFVDINNIAEHGLFLGGVKYMVIQGDAGEVIRGKKGTGGVTVKKTSSSLVIGIYNEPTTPSENNIVVEKLGDYLLDAGY